MFQTMRIKVIIITREKLQLRDRISGIRLLRARGETTPEKIQDIAGVGSYSRGAKYCRNGCASRRISGTRKGRNFSRKKTRVSQCLPEGAPPPSICAFIRTKLAHKREVKTMPSFLLLPEAKPGEYSPRSASPCFVTFHPDLAITPLVIPVSAVLPSLSPLV